MSSIVDVAALNSTTGYSAFGGITSDRFGNFYGASSSGGASGFGTVWELPKGSSSITTFGSFDGTNGEYPNSAPLVDGSGNLFGTTQGKGTQQGVQNYGSVYQIAQGTNTIQYVATFNDSTGRNPGGGLTMDAYGNLYGTTLFGGASNNGTVFEIPVGTHTITPIASFDTTVGYRCATAMVIDRNGNLFGTASAGGASNNGSIFEVPAGSNQIVRLASFDGGNSGATPQDGLLMDSQGNFFGVTSNVGREGYGSIFELARGSSTITTLAYFNSTDATGNTPNFETLVMNSNGDLFGTSEYSNDGGKGVIWELPSGANAIKALATFNSLNGNGPTGTMVADGNGNLFGTTLAGGQNGYGVVWELAGVVPEPATGFSLLAMGLGIFRASVAGRRVASRLW